MSFTLAQATAAVSEGLNSGQTSIIVIVCYLGLLLTLGLFSSRLFAGTGKDFQVASHSIGPFMLLMSLFGTTMTAFALIGSTGEAWSEGIGVYGLMASSSGIIHSLCFFVLGVKLWKFGKQYGYTTQLEFFSDRLNSRNISFILFPILVAMVIVYILTGIIGAGTVVSVFTKGAFPEMFPGVPNPADPSKMLPPTIGAVPPWLGAAIICIVVLVYVFFGGMRGTAWANTFQTLVFMILGIVTFFVIADALGTGDGIVAKMQSISSKVAESKSTRMEMSKTKFISYLFIPLSVGMFPHLFQHWLTAKSANTFKLSVVAHPVCIMLVWVPCVLLGVWATTEIAEKAIPAFAGFGPKDQNKILPFMADRLSGKWLGAFLSAGVLAAIMSSLDSQFLCVGTMFTNDIAKRLSPDGKMSDKSTVRATRLFIIAVVVVTYAVSMMNLGNVFSLGVWCFSGFSSLFPLVFAALYWRRLTKVGAYACILAAAGTWLALFVVAVTSGNMDYMISIPIGDEPLEVMPVTAMLLASTVAVIVGSLVSKPLPEETVQKFFPKAS